MEGGAVTTVRFQGVPVEVDPTIARWTKKPRPDGSVAFRCPDCSAWAAYQVARESDCPSAGQRERAQDEAAWCAVEPEDGPFGCAWCAQEDRMFGGDSPNARVEFYGRAGHRL